MTAYVRSPISDDEEEALDISTGEIIADFPSINSVAMRIEKDPTEPLQTRGHWVFLQYGMTVAD